MTFCIVVENALHPASVVAPFDHEEDARTYAQKHLALHVYRVAEIEEPKK